MTVEEQPNQPPIAGDDLGSTTENIPVNVFVLDNDFDPDGDVISIAGFDESTVAGGTITAQGNTLVYTPELGFTGTDSFIYTITDGDLTDTATVTVTVEEQPNQPPIAVDDFAETSGNIPVNIFVLDNDFDPNGDPLSIVDFAQTTAGGGTVSSAGGSLTYQPELGFFGTDSFDYTISDGELTATATVTVQQDNQLPIAVDDSAFTTEDIPINIFVLDNDVDDDVVSISNFEETTALGGQVSQDGNTLIYSPGFGFTGTDSFIYTISDSFGQTSSAVVTVNVGPDPNPNDPEAFPDEAITTQNLPVAIAVLDNDSDPDGDSISIFNFEGLTASGGSVSIDNNETPFDGSDDLLVYTPAADFTGADIFSYTITDSFGATDSTTVTVTVGPDNNPPTAVDDEAMTVEGVPVKVGVLDNDFDLDGDLLEISAFESTSSAGGTVTYDANRTINRNDDLLEYTPPADFTGTDSFTYSIVDQKGAISTATVTVTVEPMPNPPVAEDDFAETNENEPVSIDVLANDSDPDGDPLEIEGFPATTAADGTVTFDNNGTPFILDDDKLVYEPALGFNGTDSFIYTISDGELTDTATVTVTTIDQPPIALPDFAETPENTSVEINVLENDFDVNGDEIVISGLASSTVAGGTIALDAESGLPVYTPAVDFIGTDSFNYTISDGEATATALVTVDVLEVNFPPEAVDDEATTDEGELVTIDVVDNDIDPDGDDLDIVGWQQFTGNRGLIILQDNQLIYGPAPGFIGTDSFSYTISDGEFTDTAQVTVRVEEVNENPVAVDDEAITAQGIEVDISVLDNDFDPDGDPLEILEFSETTENGGAVSININLTPFDPSDDLLVYEPADDFTGTDSFIYTIADITGATDVATVNITVEPNEGTIAEDDFANTTVNVPVSIDVLVNDFDPDGDRISLEAFQLATAVGGTVNRNNNGTPGNRQDDFLIYTPAAGFIGTDSFSYSISDGRGATDSAIVTVQVDRINNRPIAVDDVAITNSGDSRAIAVLNNDFDLDGDILSIVNFSAFTSEGGNVTSDGLNLIYASAFGFSGTDSFNYTISDGQLTDTATVTVAVNMPINLPPVAGNDTGVTTEGFSTSIAVLDNDFDPEGDPLFIIGIPNTTAFGGTVALGGLDNLIYNPAFGFTGTDIFSYTIADTRSGVPAVGTVTVTVVEMENRPPNAGDDFAETTQDIPVSVFVLDNDFDPEGDALSIVGFAQTTGLGGSVSQSGNTLVYNPGLGFTGTDSFSYTISDSFGATDTATVEVSVSVFDRNNPPIAQDDFAETTQDIPVSVFVLDNDFDPEGDALSIVGFAQTTGLGGSVSQSGNTLVYNPGLGFTGTDSFSYTISDSFGATDTATVEVSVSVFDRNNPPIAQDDFAETTQDIPVSVFVLDNDFDPEGDALSIVGFAQTTGLGGSVSQSGNTLVYNPGLGFTGTDSFSYTISDSFGATDTATVTVTVSDIPNIPPVAVDDFANTPEDITTNIFVLDNDFDLDGDALSIVGFAQTTEFGGSVSQSGNTLVYNPGFGFTGTDSFSYTISDGQDTDTATVSVTVEQAGPVAFEDNVVVLQDRRELSIPVLFNDSPADGLVLVNVGTATGTVEIRGDRAIYTPNTGFTGTDSFTYTIEDSLGRSSTASVNVNVVTQLDRSGPDFIVGTDEQSQVVGTSVIRETLMGGAGNDTLIGNEGADVLSGGADGDVFAYLRLSDSGADPNNPFESGDTIVDFDPGLDSILLNFEVVPGIKVTQTDVEINLLGISNGVAAIALNTLNTPPNLLPEQFVIVLTNLPTSTTEPEIRDSLLFRG